jgi:hypothetical protein
MSRYLDWINVPVYERGRIRITRIDVLLAVFGIVCVGYYWCTSGWMSALQGGLFYVMVVMMALWMF